LQYYTYEKSLDLSAIYLQPNSKNTIVLKIIKIKGIFKGTSFYNNKSLKNVYFEMATNAPKA
jgi:hypothetical protein